MAAKDFVGNDAGNERARDRDQRHDVTEGEGERARLVRGIEVQVLREKEN